MCKICKLEGDATFNGGKGSISQVGKTRYDCIYHDGVPMAKASVVQSEQEYKQFCMDMGHSQEGSLNN